MDARRGTPDGLGLLHRSGTGARAARLGGGEAVQVTRARRHPSGVPVRARPERRQRPRRWLRAHGNRPHAGKGRDSPRRGPEPGGSSPRARPTCSGSTRARRDIRIVTYLGAVIMRIRLHTFPSHPCADARPGTSGQGLRPREDRALSGPMAHPSGRHRRPRTTAGASLPRIVLDLGSLRRAEVAFDDSSIAGQLVQLPLALRFDDRMGAAQFARLPSPLNIDGAATARGYRAGRRVPGIRAERGGVPRRRPRRRSGRRARAPGADDGWPGVPRGLPPELRGRSGRGVRERREMIAPTDAALRSRTMECRIDDAVIHYVEHGRGTPLVALHGAGVDHREIEAAIEADRSPTPGTGGSIPTCRGWDARRPTASTATTTSSSCSAASSTTSTRGR